MDRIATIIEIEIIEVVSRIFWISRDRGVSVRDSFLTWLDEGPPDWLVALVRREVFG